MRSASRSRASCSGTGSGQDTLGVLVGTWNDIKGTLAGSLIEQGPKASGVYAKFGGPGERSLELLNPAGDVVRTLTGDAGLIAATAQGTSTPTWLITGTDPAGVAAAAAAMTSARLRNHFARRRQRIDRSAGSARGGFVTYRRRSSPLHAARAAAGAAYCLALGLAALLVSNPLVLGAVAVAIVFAGVAAGVGRQMRRAAMWAVPLALAVMVINALVSRDGLTVIIRLGQLPILGHTDITLEATVYGAVLGLRATALVLCGALYTAAIDPDEVLRLFRRVSFHSALTATLATRIVPLLVRDSRRLADAQRCRPGQPAERIQPVAGRHLRGARPRPRRRGGARGARVRRGTPPAALPPAVLAPRSRVRRGGGGGGRDRRGGAFGRMGAVAGISGVARARRRFGSSLCRLPSSPARWRRSPTAGGSSGEQPVLELERRHLQLPRRRRAGAPRGDAWRSSRRAGRRRRAVGLGQVDACCASPAAWSRTSMAGLSPGGRRSPGMDTRDHGRASWRRRSARCSRTPRPRS